MSIYRRLLISLSALFAASLIATTFLAVHSTHHNIDADYDSQLISESHTILMFVHEDLEENGKLDNYNLDPSVLSFLPQEIEALHQYGRWRALRIWKGGKIMAQSDIARDLPFPMSSAGFTDRTVAGAQWRIYAIHMPKQHIVVETMENLHNRDRLIGDIVDEIFETAVVVLPLMALLLVVAIRYGLAGVRDMAAQLGRRAPDDLSPLAVGDMPSELRPLYKAINDLLARLGLSLAHEREFIDNAAHELRTPLTALRLQGQLVVDARTPDERDDAARNLQSTIDRTTGLFNQLLTLSRMQHQKTARQSVNLAELVRTCVSDRALIAADKDIEISMDGDDAQTLETHSEIFNVLLGVLLDNAIKYTPEGGQIAFVLHPDRLVITDTGPGIPDGEKDKVFGRFYRVRGEATKTQQGSGLGLAIARQACDFLGMDIRLENPTAGQGLSVVLVFKGENAQRAA